MKSRWMNNWTLKLLSLFVAFIIWLVIINITDPTITKQFNHLPVDILNENVITSSNQVYEVEDGDTVNVTVKGKRSFVEELSEQDFYASADLSKLSSVNTAGIQVKLNKVTKESVELNWNNAVLRVSLEERVTQQFKVHITAEGELADSYELGEVTSQPNIIEVSGGKSKIKRIASIGAIVQLDRQDNDFETDVTPILYDSDKDVIDSANVTFSKDKIHVNIQVLPTKTIPVYVDVKGTPATGYRHIQTDYKPESITISGTKANLEKIKSLTLPIDISDAKQDVEEEFDLTKQIDTTVYGLSEDFQTVSIRCVIEKNGKRTFSFVNSDINLKNLPSDMNFKYVDVNERHSISLTGGEADLQNVTLKSLEASIDVSGLSAGTHTVEVLFVLPNNVQLKTKVRVDIILSKSDAQQVEPTEPAATAEAVEEE